MFFRIKAQIKKKINSIVQPYLREEITLAQRAVIRNVTFALGRGRAKKVCYTCIAGRYDDLALHAHLEEGFDYVCFTDNPDLLRHGSYGAWQIRPLEFSALDDTRNSRWHKTHPHVLFPDYEESVWLDANILLLDGFLFDEIRKKDGNLLIPRHFARNCIYQEMEAVLLGHRDKKDAVERMRHFLLEERFPAHYGLSEANVIFRRHGEQSVVQIMEEWWGFIEEYSKRDQLSLSYVLWKHGVDVEQISIPNMRFQKAHVRMLAHNAADARATNGGGGTRIVKSVLFAPVQFMTLCARRREGCNGFCSNPYVQPRAVYRTRRKERA